VSIWARLGWAALSLLAVLALVCALLPLLLLFEGGN
jgi:hypothetical protein